MQELLFLNNKGGLQRFNFIVENTHEANIAFRLQKV